MYIQVNIGRNVSGEPMDDIQWNDYIAGVIHILDQCREHSEMGYGWPENHSGYGSWEGVQEESAHISLFHEGGFDLDGIRGQLRRLKNEYGQDAIALIVGSELV